MTDESDSRESSETRAGRDLPEVQTNYANYIRGFYVGFASWKMSIIGGDEPKDIDRSAWFHVGYICGWVAKLLLVIWFAQQVLPPIDPVVAPLANGVAGLGASLYAYCIAKAKLAAFMA